MCPHCHAGNPAGAFFCVACAMPILLPGPAVAVAAPPVAVAVAVARQARLVEMENLQPTGRTLPLPDTTWTGTLYLGRPDLPAGVVVDLDLNALGGFDKRVSRKHAKLHYVTCAGAPNQIRVEDWDSTHGTWVNKVRLAKGASEPLHSGDEVRFAELVFRVEVR